MGWRPGKYLKKAWKGIKKGFKSIGKGIKKAFGKIGKFFGKFGVLGQIGLAMLMGPLGNAIGGMLSGALGAVGSWGAQLVANGGWAGQALGHTLNAIHGAGTFVGKVYTTLSDTIGNAVDRFGNWTQGRGFTLSNSRASIFDPANPRSVFSGEGYSHTDHAFYSTEKQTYKVGDEVKEYDKYSGKRDRDYWQERRSSMDEAVADKEMVAREDVGVEKVVIDKEKFPNLMEQHRQDILNNTEIPKLGEEFKINTENLADNLLDPEMPKVDLSGIASDKIPDIKNIGPSESNIWRSAVRDPIGTVKDVGERWWDNVTSITSEDVADKTQSLIDESITGGVSDALYQKAAIAAGYELGDQKHSYFIMQDRIEVPSAYNVYDTVDLAASRQDGNLFAADMFSNAGFYNNIIHPGNDVYGDTMSYLGFNHYVSENPHGQAALGRG